MLKKIKDIIEDNYQISFDDALYVAFYIYILMGHFINHTQIFQIGSLVFCFIEIVYIIKNKKMYISNYSVFYFLFIIYCILQNKLGITQRIDSANDLMDTLWINLVLNFFALNYLLTKDNFKLFPKIYSQTGFIFCIYMLLSNITKLGEGRLGDKQYVIFGLNNMYYQSNNVGFILAYTFNMYMYRILVSKEKKCIPCAVICAVGAFLTGSRKALIIVIVGMFFLIYCFYEGEKKLKIIVIGIFTAIAMYIAVMNIPIFYNTVGVRFEDFIEGEKTGNVVDDSVKTREKLLDIAKEYYEKKPWLGYGLNNYKDFKGTVGLYSHNNFYEVLCNNGRIGFVLFYMPYLISLICLMIGFIKKNKLAILGTVCLIVYMVMECGIVTYFERTMQTILIFCIVAGTKVISMNKEKNLQKDLI